MHHPLCSAYSFHLNLEHHVITSYIDIIGINPEARIRVALHEMINVLLGVTEVHKEVNENVC